MEKKHSDTIVLLGHTGSGKSETCNSLAGHQGLFKSSPDSESCTQETTVQKVKWFGREDENDLVIVDTPGMGDSQGGDSAHIAEMVDALKGKIKKLRAFLIVLNGQQPRLDSHLKAMLQLFTSIFSKRMWSNTMIVCTHWAYDEASALKRESSKETEEERSASVRAFLQKKFDLDVKVPVVFIDNMYEREEVARDATDAEMQRHRETLDAIQKFVGRCKNFDCQHIEKCLSEVDKLAEQKE